MSKAFTREDDAGLEEPEAEADAEPTKDANGRPLKPGAKAYITPQGYRKLQDELEHLWKVERPRVTSEVAAAAAQGDRSENAEYIYGKKRLREIDRRVRFLSKRLDVLAIVTPSKEQHGKVFFGAWVTIEDEEGHEATYRIVGGDEFDSDRGWISVDSPLARALLGKAEGEEATVVRPKGRAQVVVVRVTYEAP
jgi:transcription elongation factor GreB